LGKEGLELSGQGCPLPTLSSCIGTSSVAHLTYDLVDHRTPCLYAYSRYVGLHRTCLNPSDELCDLQESGAVHLTGSLVSLSGLQPAQPWHGPSGSSPARPFKIVRRINQSAAIIIRTIEIFSTILISLIQFYRL